jgi:ABC-type multidrug transport system fused ATPase/permease subunit
VLLEDVDWTGEAWFRMLDHYCSVRWNADALGATVLAVLAPFSVTVESVELDTPPTPHVLSKYSLLDRGAAKAPRYQLFYGDWSLSEGSEPAEVLKYLFWHVGTEASQRTGSYLLIHAGAVVAPRGDGLIFPGPSGSGKSTLVAALVRAGFDYLSDEAAALDPVSRRIYPFP